MVVKVIIFDLWNTLIPVTIDFTVMRTIIGHEHVPLGKFIEKYERSVQLKKYRSFEGLKKDLFRAFHQENNADLEELLVEIYFKRFDKIHYFGDVPRTLTKLQKKGYTLALLSNTESIMQPRLEKILALNKYFDGLFYSFQKGVIKPDARAYRAVLTKFKAKPSEAVMVGDSLRSDIAGAKALGIHTVWLNRKGKAYDLAKVTPEIEINTLNELYPVLQKFEQGEKNGSGKTR